MTLFNGANFYVWVFQGFILPWTFLFFQMTFEPCHKTSHVLQGPAKGLFLCICFLLCVITLPLIFYKGISLVSWPYLHPWVSWGLVDLACTVSTQFPETYIRVLWLPRRRGWGFLLVFNYFSKKFGGAEPAILGCSDAI